MREGARRRAGAAARVPSRLGREHLRDELRGAVGQRRHRAEPRLPRWRAACRTPARAASRPTIAAAASWSTRSAAATSAAGTSTAGSTSPRFTDTVASAPVRALEIKLSQGAKPGLGGVLPRAKVSAEISAARGRPARRGLRQPVAARGVLRRRRDARLGRDARRRDRAPGRDQVRGRRSGVLARARPPDGGHRARGRPRDDRRRRGRHGRCAPGVRGLGEPAVPARLQPGLQDLRGGRAARARGVRGLRQAGAAGERRRRLRPRRGPGQRRPRGDVVDRVRPGPEVPHRPLPDRRDDAEPVARARAGPRPEVGALRQLHPHAAPGPAEARGGDRRRAPRADRLPVGGDPHGAVAGDAAARGVRLRPGLGLPVGGGPRRGRPPDAGDRSPGRPGSRPARRRSASLRSGT